MVAGPSPLERENRSRDAALSTAIHGQSAKARGGFAAILSKNKGGPKDAHDEYFKYWDNEAVDKETAEQRAVRILLFSPKWIQAKPS
jgi:sterol 24-C-methyltransferase